MLSKTVLLNLKENCGFVAKFFSTRGFVEVIFFLGALGVGKLALDQ
jgi:hypothetical protein